MPIVTEKTYTVTDVGVKSFGYGDIATFDATNITDDSILQVSHQGALLSNITHYTVDEVNENVDLVAEFTLTIGDTISISRETDVEEPFVDFINNSTIESSDLDLAVQQLLFAIQELKTDTDNSLRYDIVNDCYDALSRRICNLASGTASTDAVNLGQVQNLLAGVDTAEVDNITRWSFTGDGTTTEYVLTDPPSGLVEESQAIVSVDGVVQLPTTNYVLAKDGTTSVTFTAAPALGAVVQIITANGIVSVSFPDGSISGDALEDDAVGLTKINVGVGDADRFLVFDINGDPTAQTIDHTLISDFDTGVRTSRLDQMAVPTSAMNFNSQQLTGITAGSSPSHAVNKSQMEAAITAAIPTGSTDVGAVVVSGSTSTNLSADPVVISSLGDTAVFVSAQVNNVDGASYAILEVKTAAGSYIETGRAELGNGSDKVTLTGLIPAGGMAKISGAASANLTRLTTQTFS